MFVKTMINDLKIPPVPTAFFDLDGTLLHSDSNTLWIKWRLRRDLRALPELAIALRNSMSYKQGRLTDEQMFSYFAMRSRGLTKEAFAARARRFFQQAGMRNVYPEGRGLVEAHRARGIPTVLITGQEETLAQPFREYLGLDHLIGNRQERVGRKLEGFARPNCYGAGKIELAAAYLQPRGIELSACSFFSDSISDLPLLQKVGYPVVVNPDAELEKVARSRSWPVLRFAL